MGEALRWSLECSSCGAERSAEGLASVCDACGQPLLVRYRDRPAATERPGAHAPWSMWRYRAWLPIHGDEIPVTLGEGGTALLPVPRIARKHGLSALIVKDESTNPTGSFKARGLALAVTRALGAGARAFVVPTAGNAGVALAAYARRGGAAARVVAPVSTPRTILAQIREFGAELVLLDGHIGDCAREARAYAKECGAVDVSTLREPYRIEGKKTLGLEVAEQLGWRLPDAVVYPAGGGTGLIGMWKAFAELRAARWVSDPLPRMFAVQAEGCAPIVRAFEAGAARCEPWEGPTTAAAGLRVPAPFGDRLMLQAIRESGGAALAVSERQLSEAATALREEGIDAAPEGGAALAGAIGLRERGAIARDDHVVVFNTGAGWLYRP